MATFNSSHHDSGGVVLFSGELILLYCDNVYINIDSKSQNVLFIHSINYLLNY
jgi:hypothetical protein